MMTMTMVMMMTMVMTMTMMMMLIMTMTMTAPTIFIHSNKLTALPLVLPSLELLLHVE